MACHIVVVLNSMHIMIYIYIYIICNILGHNLGRSHQASRKSKISCQKLRLSASLKFPFSRQMDELPAWSAKKNHPGWYECDAARRIASIKSEFDFWTILSHYDDAKNVSSFAQKLLTCYSSIRNVEKDATNLLFDIGHSTSTERWHHKRSILCNFNCRDQEERNGAKFEKRRANRDECFPSSTCMQ